MTARNTPTTLPEASPASKGEEWEVAYSRMICATEDVSLYLVHAAAWNGEVGALKLLHHFGMDVNRQNDLGETPMHYAAVRGHVELIRVLRSLGADIEKTTLRRSTPAHWAAAEGKTDVIRTLHELGADFRRTDLDGRTPYSWALKNDQKETATAIKQLLDKDP